MSLPSTTGAGEGAPITLAFDTAASACSVAVGRGNTVIAHERRVMRHGHAETLLPMIDRVMAAAGLAAADIDIIAVSVGPGGFTGIRAGIAAAQGLALAARAKLVGVTSFAAVAALLPKDDGATLVSLDSRREELYVTILGDDGRPLAAPAAVMADELGEFVGRAIGATRLRIAGDATTGAADALADRASVTVVCESAPDALGVLAAAKRSDFAVAARPLYLRPPDVSFPKPSRASLDRRA